MMSCTYGELSPVEGKSQRELNYNGIYSVALCPVTRYNAQLIACQLAIVNSSHSKWNHSLLQPPNFPDSLTAEGLRAVTDPGLFKKRLKTHFFSLAFCVC